MGKKKKPALEDVLETGMIDSHFHTAMMGKKNLDIRKLLSRSVELGLAGGIDIGVHAGDCAERSWLTKEFPRFKIAAGLAPAEAEHEDIHRHLALLEDDIRTYNVEAVGEMGVDAYWNYGSPERQRDLFSAQIEMANTHGLPIIIHNREADRLLLEVLSSHRPEYGGIMHCFSSTYETAVRCIDYGLLISFAGNITYKKSEELKEAARRIPEAALLAETDSPFLSPEPVRGEPNHPGQVAFVYRYLSQLRGVELQELVTTIAENYHRLFPSDT